MGFIPGKPEVGAAQSRPNDRLSFHCKFKKKSSIKISHFSKCISDSAAHCLELKLYTRSLAPSDFSGAVFTYVHLQKIAKISSLFKFHYISQGIPFLVINDLSHADLVHG